MRHSVYLHKEIVSTLRMFGELNDVVNRIIDAGMDGYFDVVNKPPCPPRDNVSRYVIDIENPDYLQIMESYPTNSPIFSLSRLIYWFVENQIYEELGWKVNKEFLSYRKEQALSLLNKAIDLLSKARKEVYDAQKPCINKAIVDVQDCIKEVRNGI